MPKLTKIAAAALIALAVLLGLFAWTLSRRPEPAPVNAAASQASYPVVVATHVLPAGKAIAADALRIQNLPINPNGAFTDPSLLVGRVPVADIGEQTPVVESQLSSGLAEQIGAGERAVAVHVEEANAVGNRLRPGNLVDVFFTLKRDNAMAGGSEIEQSQARLLMSKVRVLTFGNATTAADAPGDSGGLVRTAVLAVPVADVDRLTLAEASGRLVFALRNPRDADVAASDAFAPLPTVLKTAAQVGAGQNDSTRAAAGLSLDALSGAGGAGANRAPQPTRPLVQASATAPRPAAAHAPSQGGIEVIRGGRTDMVAR